MIAKTIQTIARVSFYLLFALIFFKMGCFYSDNKEPGETAYKFYTSGHSLDIQSIPNIRLQYNYIVKLIWFSIASSMIIIISDYWIDPKNHFITKWRDRSGTIHNNIKEQ